jgi:hypothetical protein
MPFSVERRRVDSVVGPLLTFAQAANLTEEDCDTSLSKCGIGGDNDHWSHTQFSSILYHPELRNIAALVPGVRIRARLDPGHPWQIVSLVKRTVRRHSLHWDVDLQDRNSFV